MDSDYVSGIETEKSPNSKHNSYVIFTLKMEAIRMSKYYIE